MGKTLIVAEKPSVGRDISDALPGAFKKVDGGKYLESDDHVVTWAVGHLVELQEPEDYDDKWKKWRRVDLPILPEQFKLRPRSGDSEKQLKLIHELAARDDVDDIINACDAGREGELIFAYTMDLSPVQKPVRRLWISSMTKKSIRDGFDQLKPGEEMRDLEASARSRSEADWLVGMNATRAATVKARSAFGGVVSIGRVQTPTLGILATREQEIADFVPEAYHVVQASFLAEGDRRWTGTWFDQAKNASDPRGTWVLDAEDASTLDEETRAQNGATRAASIVAKVEGKHGSVVSADIRKQSERPPLLYDLTSLQRDANRRFGYSARRTLSAAQGLYEAHKVLTYPRTSSRYLTTDMVDELKPRARMLQANPVYEAAAKYVTALPELPLERVVDDAKVDDHHAIIPTELLANVDKLRDDEKRIYDLVVRRFLAVFHPIARFELTTLVTEVESERFRTRGRVMVEAGWKAVYGTGGDATAEDSAAAKDGAAAAEEESEQQQLPKVEQGEEAECTAAEAERKQTKPPARYSEGTLLSAMETAGRLVDDEALREILKDRGLGTPATRASVIELLVNRQYIQREGRALRVTGKGMKLIEILDGHPLTSPEMTGDWEQQLRTIEHGQLSHDVFLKGIVDFTKGTVEKILEIDREKLKVQRAELGPCPRCAAAGREEIIRENSRAYGCTSWKGKEETGCGFVIWRTIAGRQLMPDEAMELLTNRVTAQELQGFRSRAGKGFRAKLRLTDEDKVEFVFPEGVGKNRAGKPSPEALAEAQEAEQVAHPEASTTGSEGAAPDLADVAAGGVGHGAGDEAAALTSA